MAGNSFGTLFRVTTWGESHGPALGVVIDGCPAGLKLDIDGINYELQRRRPGQSTLVSPRKEGDEFEILSGLFEGLTTGAPLSFLIRNEDVKSKDYEAIKNIFRPGHADFSYFAKYGHRDYRGGGRSSARETVGRVIGGAVAKQILGYDGITVRGAVLQIGKVKATQHNWEQVENNEVRSLDGAVVAQMVSEIETARKAKDSVGGIVEIQALGVKPGLGEPVFDKLEALLAYALMSIPAVKGVEIGAGFSSAEMRGSELNDQFYPDGFRKNDHGGILGGISSGAPIVARFVVKPTASIPMEQDTIDSELKAQRIVTRGRHDPCVAMRAVPIGEAMVALVLVDLWLQNLAVKGVREFFAPQKSITYGMKQ